MRGDVIYRGGCENTWGDFLIDMRFLAYTFVETYQTSRAKYIYFAY